LIAVWELQVTDVVAVFETDTLKSKALNTS
jgi:hypothetical protein